MLWLEALPCSNNKKIEGNKKTSKPPGQTEYYSFSAYLNTQWRCSITTYHWKIYRQFWIFPPELLLSKGLESVPFSFWQAPLEPFAFKVFQIFQLEARSVISQWFLKSTIIVFFILNPSFLPYNRGWILFF